MMSFIVPTYQADELQYFLTGEKAILAETFSKKIVNTKLNKKDYQEAASKLGAETEAVMAFAIVESRGNGFLEDERPKILFEGHKFYKHLKKLNINPEEHRLGNENIIYRYSELKNMNPKPYKGGAKEYERMEKAKAINEEAALLSASYGAFQIMGENYSMCGYKDIYEFVEAMKSAKEQLLAFINFAESAKITKYLKEKNWQEVAKRYNGPDYKKNKYDEKFSDAYEKFKNEKNE